MRGLSRGFPFLLVIDAVSGSLGPEGRIASSAFLSLVTLATVDATVCPDNIGSSTSPPCSEELEDDDDMSSRIGFGVGPPNIGIHWSRGTDKRPEIDSGYREMTLAGLMFKLTNDSSARSNSPERNCETASSALARLVRLSFNDYISAGSYANQRTHTLSGRRTASILSRKARASAYFPASMSSSTCSPHDFMRKHHIELPSEAAVARSVGVLTRKRGDLSGGDGVKRRNV